jgi:hypothetical protein
LDQALGLIALAGYILGIVGLAAAITYVVIRIFPTERTSKKDTDTPAEPEKQGSASAEGEGSLFRRSKREKKR